MKIKLSLAFVILLGILCTVVVAQSRSVKNQAKIEESAKPKNVAGGVKFQVEKSYQDTYDALLNWVKRADYTLETADKETGIIRTAMTITGGYTQTGTRLILTLIKDTNTTTTVRVVVSEQKRKKLLQIEPWGDPKINEKESQRVAEETQRLF